MRSDGNFLFSEFLIFETGPVLVWILVCTFANKKLAWIHCASLCLVNDALHAFYPSTNNKYISVSSPCRIEAELVVHNNLDAATCWREEGTGECGCGVGCG